MHHLALLERLAQPTDSKIVLLVLDGVGDLRSADQPQTALDAARIPNLDALASGGASGRLVPVLPGVTPGSGPGHLSLFGYHPAEPDTDIGRGVLEALGLGLDLAADEVAVRGNFATADADGNLTDRRAGRISTAECLRLSAILQQAANHIPDLDIELSIHAAEGHRFVMILRGSDLSDDLADTDPQRLGVPPLPFVAESPQADSTASRLDETLPHLLAAIADEPKANRLLLRGFSRLPHLPQMPELYKLRCGAFAGYPLYRGVASSCGMEVVECGKTFPEIVDVVAENWQRFDYFFLHVKQTDQAGEDGDLAAKIAVLETVDAHIPRLLALKPEVVAVTADHSTPAPLRAHSWHPVPVILHSEVCFIDEVTSYSEAAATHGHLGTIPAWELMGLMLANAGKLAKFGA